MDNVKIAGLMLSACLLTACASTSGGGSSAPAGPPPGNWQQAADAENQVAWVDVDSLQQTNNGLRTVSKVNFAQPQPWGNGSFQSARNTFILDCAGRRLADRENLIFEGPDLSGKQLSRASRNQNNLIWRDAPARSVDGEILAFSCRQYGTPAP